MKRLVLVALVLLLVGSAAAEIQYSIDTGVERTELNATLRLDCRDGSGNCPVNSWRLTWLKPENAEIVSVRDSLGKIDDFSIDGDQVLIETNEGQSRETETVRIEMVMEKDAQEVHAGLYKQVFSLSGFQGEETSGSIGAENLVSGRTNFGFETSFTGNEMRFRGDGPVNIRMKFGDGFETQYFEFFGSEPKDTEVAYEIPIGMLGVVQGFERFPVAVMDDETYDRKVNEWSAGEYIGGAIQIRSQDDIPDDFLPVLAHEVVHGLNDRELNWYTGRSSYFDEGVSKYVEFLVKRQLYNEGKIESRPRELFGDEVKYTKEENGKKFVYTAPSKGDKDRLWNYYQEDMEFMKNWNAVDSSPENRKFGYAYSELIIRNYIAEGGSLKQLYKAIQVNREVESPDAKWSIYSEHLDMTPCEYGSRDRFEQCLEKVNDYDYPVYRAKPVRNDQPLEIEELKVPNRTQNFSKGALKRKVGSSTVSIMEFASGFIDYWASFFQGLLR